MRISREQFLEQRLRATQIHLIQMAIASWLLGAGWLITLAVVFDKLPG